MKEIRIYCGVVIMLLGIFSSLKGQDALYSQYYVTPSLINPAFTGNTYGGYVTTIARTQWLSHDLPYNTVSLSYSQQYNEASGIGLYIISDRTSNGSLFANKIEGMYSIKVKMDESTYLKGGAALGYTTQRLDTEKFIFYDNLDPRYGSISPGGVKLPTAENFSNNSSNSYIDLSAGILIYNPNFYGGFSLKHINRPNNSFIDSQDSESENIPLLVSLQAGLQIDLTQRKEDKIYFSPNALGAYQSGSWQAVVGGLLNYDAIFGGLWYRYSKQNGDAVITSVGVKYGIFKISYSYDYTISELTIGSGGAHEIGVSLNFEEIRPKKSRYSDCFEVFR